MLTDELTERRLKELESQIAEMYRTSSKELGDKAAAYFKKFETRDAEMRGKLDGGQITKDEYKQWRMTQIGRGKRWKALQSEISRRAVHADQIAADYINGVTPNLYAENYNYQAFTIEQAATRMTVNGFTSDVSFTIMNEDTVKRLMTGKNHIGFRTVRVNPKRDYNWNARRIQNELTAGIIQGESMGTIANRFYSVMGSNRKAAVRNARTAVTSAQNGGRMDAMRRAMEQGYPAKKQWVATMDERTRLSHILLGQEIVDADKPFSNGLMYPGDPDGDPSEVYNCRCTMVDADDRFRTAQDDELDAMYQAWKAEKIGTETVAMGGRNGIIKDIDEYMIPVTKKSIDAVPLVELDGFTQEMNRHLQVAHRDLLTSAMNAPEGTEFASVHRMDMSRVGEIIRGGQRKSVNIPDQAFEYIALHNHPSGLIFSPDDLLSFFQRNKLRILTVVGNDGGVYVIKKKYNSSDLDCIKILANHRNQLDDFVKDYNIIGYASEMEMILKECGEYGVEFIESRA